MVEIALLVFRSRDTAFYLRVSNVVWQVKGL